MKFFDKKLNAFLASQTGTVLEDISGEAGSDAQTTAIQKAWLTDKRERKEVLCRANIEDLEEKLLPVLADMEAEGIFVDTGILEIAGKIADEKIEIATQAIQEIAKTSLNPGSPKEVQTLLFERLGLKPLRKTKTGFSVDEETLAFYAQEHPICRYLLEWRKVSKLRSTYIHGLIPYINPVSGRIHSSFVQTRTTTGRLSSENPNLQNIPQGGELADLIKSSFQPQDSMRSFVVADYSQMELRILANMSEDAAMCERFLQKEDIHLATAKSLFATETVTPEMRRQAKVVNFWVLYGMTAFGLAQELNIAPKEAQGFIDNFFQAYPQVRIWSEKTILFAKENGYVETWHGRRRYIPSINDANANIRFRAEREAVNLPIQGTEADIMKYAMIAVHERFAREHVHAKILLQIHDELVVECDDKEQEHVQKILSEELVGAPPKEWKIPLDIHLHVGKNWLDAKW